MIFKSYWRRMVAKLINRTPGIGMDDDADRAVERSRRAVVEAESTLDKIKPAVDYLNTSADANHFRERVADALTRRTAQ